MKKFLNSLCALFYLIAAVEIPLRAAFLKHSKSTSLLMLSDYNAGIEIAILVACSLFLLPRVLKMVKELDFQHDMNPVAVKASICIVSVLLLAHWVACGWLALRADTSEPAFTSYIKAVYWAVASLTTVGYGDIVPQTTAQYAYAVLVMLIGIAMYASIVGLIANFLSRRDHAFSDHQERLDKLRSYLQYHKVPYSLRKRIWNHYDYIWNNKLGVEQFNLLSEIPEPVKTEVAVFLVGDLLKASEIFMHANAELVSYIAPRLKFRLSMPSEVIVAEGAAADEMYFINKGEVEILKSGNVVSTLKSGEHFGEMALLNEQTKRTATVIAKTVVEHYALERDSFYGALKLFPDFAEQIKSTADARGLKKVHNS